MTHGHSQLPKVERAPKPPLVGLAIPLSLLLAALLLFLFSWIAEEVLENHTRNFDSAIRNAVHQHASPALTRAAIAASFLGEELLLVVVPLALVIFLIIRWKRAAAWLAITMAGALVLTFSLKLGFHRTRPTAFFGTVPYGYSFPSGHALISFCFYGVMAGLLADRIKPLAWRITIWAVASVLVLCIGLSRIYLGVHYPTDVAAGYTAAAVWVSAMIGIDRWRIRRRDRHGHHHVQFGQK